MSSSTSACTGCVNVLQDQQQAVLQHQNGSESPLAKLKAKHHKLCTVIENGQVVVRPVEPVKAESE